MTRFDRVVVGATVAVVALLLLNGVMLLVGDATPGAIVLVAGCVAVVLATTLPVPAGSVTAGRWAAFVVSTLGTAAALSATIDGLPLGASVGFPVAATIVLARAKTRVATAATGRSTERP